MLHHPTTRTLTTPDRRAPHLALRRRAPGAQALAARCVAALVVVLAAIAAVAVPAGAGGRGAPDVASVALAVGAGGRGGAPDVASVVVPAGAGRGVPDGPSVAGRAGAGGRGGPYLPPVDAPVVDPFHLPDTPYGAGNRGLEYATVPGTAVRASAAGIVTFAGQVGGALFVTVAHPDGIRTSYAFLARVAVVLGQPVRQGQVVGLAGARFHFGARVGDAYIDPAALLSGAAFAVVLLPLARGPGLLRRALASLPCCPWPLVA